MEMEYDIEFITGLRRDSKLVYDPREKQIYVKKYSRKNICFYTCYKRGLCKATIVVAEDTGKLIRGIKVPHTHGDQEREMKKMKFVNSIKRDCNNAELSKTLSAKEIFELNRPDIDDNVLEVSFKSIKRTLNKIRMASLQQNASGTSKCPVSTKGEPNNFNYLADNGDSCHYKDEEANLAACKAEADEIDIELSQVQEFQSFLDPTFVKSENDDTISIASSSNYPVSLPSMAKFSSAPAAMPNSSQIHAQSMNTSMNASVTDVNIQSMNNNILLDIQRKLTKESTEDEFDIVGKNFAWKLRALPESVRMVTEKLMLDILFQAQIGNVNNSTTISLNQN